MPVRPRSGILDIVPYVGGESSIRARADKPVIRLTSNENPFGASVAAAQAYRDCAARLHLYPQSSHLDLRLALADVHGLDAEKILCSNGSDELIHLLCQCYLDAGDEVIYTRHGFLMYPIAARTMGAKPLQAAEVDFTADVDSILSCVSKKTKMVFLANPNNPTGSYLGREKLRLLRSALDPGILLVLDGAYAEYVTAPDYDDGAGLVEAYDNVVMLRTFSKIYALAGLRLGWGYFPSAVLAAVARVRGPFNVNGPALAAGLAALRDQSHLAASRAHNSRWLADLPSALRHMGLDCLPAVGNFVLIKTGDRTAQIYDFLCRHNVFVRTVDAYGLPEFLRVTIGKDAEMQEFLNVLREAVLHNV